MAQDDPGNDVGGSLTHEDIVGLLNTAQISDNQDDKQHLLAQVFEFAFNSHQRQYLSEFFPHLLEFQLDRLISDENGNVAKRAILCATNIWRSGLDYLCTGGGQKATPQQQSTWVGMSDMKSRILKSLDQSDNDTLKPHALKFIETLVLTFSHHDPPAPGDKKNKMDTFSLDRIPSGHALLAPGILEREGDSYVTLLVEQMRKPGQTATTVSSLVNTLAAIARHRPHFIQKISQALISIQQQPSPSLSSFVPSQQQNVNHSLRLALQSILRLRHATLTPWVVALVDSLSALGAKDAIDEATKLYGDLAKLPQPPPPSHKRTDPPDSPSRDHKKIKTEPSTQHDVKPSQPPPLNPSLAPPNFSLPPSNFAPPSESPPGSTDQLSMLSLLAGLPVDLVVKLVFENMPAVPFPPQNTPLPTNVSELLRSLQLVPAQAPTNATLTLNSTPTSTLNPTSSAIPTSTLAPAPRVDPRTLPRDPRKRPAPSENETQPTPNVPPATQATQSQPTSTLPPQSHAQPGAPNPPEPAKSPPSRDHSPPLGPSLTTAALQLPALQPQQLTQPFPPVKPQIPKAPVLPLPTFTDAQLRSLSDATFARLMSSEAGATRGGKRHLWVALVARLASTLALDGEMAQKLVTYVIADFTTRRELVHTWVYHEFISSPEKRYPQLVDALLAALRTLDPANRAFNALIVEMPRLPEEVWTMMCEYSTSHDRVTLGLSTLRDLVVWRPPLRDRGLALLLDYTHHEDEAIRSPAIRLVANQLYPLPALTQAIVEHAIAMLRSLAPARTEQDADMRDPDQDVEMRETKIKAEPTDEEKSGEAKANGERKEDSEDKKIDGDGDKPIRDVQEMFSEGQIQRKLFLYFALCTKKHDLLTGLLDVYMTATPGVRKVIHHQMSVLINTIGMNSVPLLQLIAQCPKGGEGFVLQVLRILTETSRPLPGLVNAVKTAHKRLGDARLLIPVMGGMEKDEVIALLPRLLMLPPAAAKTVVTRLAIGHSPLACTELLVALHLVENVPIKRMLEATQYCLEIESVFKQDVMAVVLSQLSSQPTVPQLFMFTALQTLQRLHKLTGYIIELMINLIPKQVWADKRLWDGFIRCCKVAKPTSYKVLLKLPAGPLEDFLKGSPEFKEPLAKAAKADRKSIPKAVLKVLGFEDPAAEEQA